MAGVSDPRVGALRVGVVGLGSIGSRHLRNLAAAGVGSLVATDADPAKAAVARASGARWAPGLAQVLDAAPDLVFVCTPTHLHREAAVVALEAGAHLFVEKPIAVTREDAQAIAAAAERSGRVAMVGANMRFHPGPAALKRLLDEGAVGRPLLLRAEFGQYLPDWRPQTDYRRTYSARMAEGGGILVEAVHEFDYLRWLAGPVTGVDARWARVSDLEVDGEDTAVFTLAHASGAVSATHVDYLRPEKARGCEVVGSEGVAVWRSDGPPPEHVHVRLYSRATGAWTDVVDEPVWDGNAMYVDELTHLLACVLDGSRPAQTAREGAEALGLALRAREAGGGTWA